MDEKEIFSQVESEFPTSRDQIGKKKKQIN